MALSQKTIQKLALALKDDALMYLQEDVSFKQELLDSIIRFIDDKLGEMEIDLAYEISQEIIESIVIK